MGREKYDVLVVGSGPNGLSAAIRLAQMGMRVKVVEAKQTIGGGTRTEELTLPGFQHDICSAIHPLGMASPFWQQLPLKDHGLEWIHPIYPLAHPMLGKRAVVMHQSMERTAMELESDAGHYLNLFEKLLADYEVLLPVLLSPFSGVVKHPLSFVNFGCKALLSAQRLARSNFKNERSQALFAGLAAHGMLPLDAWTSSAAGLVLGMSAHQGGWPFPKGGAHRITLALASYFQSLGGVLQTERKICHGKDLEEAKTIFFDLTPHQILQIAGNQIPASYRTSLAKYRYGSGIYKLDIAVSEPIPWTDLGCRKAGTVHLGNTLQEIANAEKGVSQGRHPEKPFVIVAQQSVFDNTRAPAGKHTVWAYCHVPNGSHQDMSDAIKDQIERFAPGFRDSILAEHGMNTHAMHNYNPNYIGGDINGGIQGFRQLYTRPVRLWNPYKIPHTRFYICSSSTPPGGGVHGMCGYHAAEAFLRTMK